MCVNEEDTWSSQRCRGEKHPSTKTACSLEEKITKERKNTQIHPAATKQRLPLHRRPCRRGHRCRLMTSKHRISGTKCSHRGVRHIQASGCCKMHLVHPYLSFLKLQNFGKKRQRDNHVCYDTTASVAESPDAPDS